MIYNVITFDRVGHPIRESVITAQNHLEAANIARGIMATHARVKGRVVKRFSYEQMEPVLIDSAPTIHRVYLQQKPALLLMFDRIPEFVVYSYNDNRNKAYMECTRLASAESANLSPALIDTTVYSGAMFGSKSGSMLKRTLSGSAVSVTCSDLLTPSSIDGYFGSGKSKGLDYPAWKPGSTPSLSKSPKQIFAKVNTRNMPHEWPTINSSMLRLHGKVMLFTETMLDDKKLYNDEFGWCYLPKWLETRNIKLKVSPDAPLPYRRLHGKVLRLNKCSCGCNAYFTGRKYFASDNHYIDMEWLSIPDRSESG